jgi:hypothetical protein
MLAYTSSSLVLAEAPEVHRLQQTFNPLLVSCIIGNRRNVRPSSKDNCDVVMSGVRGGARPER